MKICGATGTSPSRTVVGSAAGVTGTLAPTKKRFWSVTVKSADAAWAKLAVPVSSVMATSVPSTAMRTPATGLPLAVARS